MTDEKGSSEDGTPLDELIPQVYDELRRIAHQRNTKEWPENSLQTTEILHEAFLKICHRRDGRWPSKEDFLAAASEAMRHVLIDHARAKQRLKRSDGRKRIELSDDLGHASTTDSALLLEIDEAIDHFERIWPENATLVKLRFFVGLTLDEAAKAMGISKSAAFRKWTFSRAWILQRLQEGSDEQDPGSAAEKPETN